MRHNSRFLHTVILVLICVQTTYAGAWVQNRGRVFFKLSEEIARARGYHELSGNRINIPLLSVYSTNIYAEYGWTDRVTLIGYIPLVRRITLNRQVGAQDGFVFFPGDANTRWGDADLGVRIGVRKDRATVISVLALAGLPVGDHRQSNGLYTGDGEVNQYVALQAGLSFYPTPIHISGEFGFNQRWKGFSDEWRFAFEAGYTIAGRWTLTAHLRGVESLRNGDDALTGGVGGLGGNNQRYLIYGSELSVLLASGFGFTAGAHGVTLGRNVLSAPMYTFGFFIAR